jgi:WD40 repeat protein
VVSRHGRGSPPLHVYRCPVLQIATGGMDKAVKLFDLASSTVRFRTRFSVLPAHVTCFVLACAVTQTTATLNGHSKKVSGVILHPSVDAVVSSSFDHTVKIWSNQGGSYNCSFTLKPHTDAVAGIALQPCGDYVVSASADRTWSFSNITTGRVLGTFADDSVTTPYTCIDVSTAVTLVALLACNGGHRGLWLRAQMHPDGLLIATGSEDSVIRIWDLKNVSPQRRVETRVCALCFGLARAKQTLRSSKNTRARLVPLRSQKMAITWPLVPRTAL